MHAHAHTHAHSEGPTASLHRRARAHTHTHAHSRCHGHSHPHALFSPGEPGGRDSGRSRAGADVCNGVPPCSSEGRRSRGPGCAADDSAASPSPGLSAEPQPGRAALAPALCYANSPSQLVPAACTMSAPSPLQSSPAREWGRGVGLLCDLRSGSQLGPAWRGGGLLPSNAAFPRPPLPHASRAAPLGACRASTDSFQSPRLPAFQVPGLDEK